MAGTPKKLGQWAGVAEWRLRGQRRRGSGGGVPEVRSGHLH